MESQRDAGSSGNWCSISTESLKFFETHTRRALTIIFPEGKIGLVLTQPEIIKDFLLPLDESLQRSISKSRGTINEILNGESNKKCIFICGPSRIESKSQAYKCSKWLSLKSGKSPKTIKGSISDSKPVERSVLFMNVNLTNVQELMTKDPYRSGYGILKTREVLIQIAKNIPILGILDFGDDGYMFDDIPSIVVSYDEIKLAYTKHNIPTGGLKDWKGLPSEISQKNQITNFTIIPLNQITGIDLGKIIIKIDELHKSNYDSVLGQSKELLQSTKMDIIGFQLDPGERFPKCFDSEEEEDEANDTETETIDSTSYVLLEDEILQKKTSFQKRIFKSISNSYFKLANLKRKNRPNSQLNRYEQFNLTNNFIDEIDQFLQTN